MAGLRCCSELGRKFDCARFGPPIDRCSATLAAFGTEEQKENIYRASRERNSRSRDEGMPFGPRKHELPGRADRRRFRVHSDGEKLWCTNLIKAGVLVVMAVTPPKIVNGRRRKQITALSSM